MTSEPSSRPDFDQIPEQALAWTRAGKKAALATVVATWGSAPRPVGAQLAISEHAELAGSVSGGCVESAVAAEALEAMDDGRVRRLSFGVSDDDAFAVGLACGGEIQVLVDPIGAGEGLPVAHLERLVTARAGREAVGYAVNLADASRSFMTPADAPEAFASDRSRRLDDETAPDRGRFLTIHNPPLRMISIGAPHIAQALVPIAQAAGYDVFVADPRGAFATQARFPDLVVAETLFDDWPDAVFDRLGLDARTAVVCLTHDPKIDDPALMRALPSGAFYVGALGSTRTHAKRAARLAEAGLAQHALARLHAPIGLDIGARSPAEIAISILAQTTERLRRPESRPENRAAA